MEEVFFRGEDLKILESLWDITGIHHTTEEFFLQPLEVEAKRKYHDDTAFEDSVGLHNHYIVLLKVNSWQLNIPPC